MKFSLSAVVSLLLWSSNTASAEVRRRAAVPHDSYVQEILQPIPIDGGSKVPDIKPKAEELELRLKHIFHHGTYKYPGLHRRVDVSSDIDSARVLGSYVNPNPPLRVRSVPTTIQRLVNRNQSAIDEILEFGQMTGQPMQLSASAWTIDDIAGPNVTDRQTVLAFANMSSNSYHQEPDEGQWKDVQGGWHYRQDFGWADDGLRGHIYATSNNSTVVIAFKGTTPAVFDGSETTTRDKENDNLLFSCCCGQGGQYLWRRVCDCSTDTYTCNSTCLLTELKEKNRYYHAGMDLYRNVTELYPGSDVWITGHSLGGAIGSLLGMTYGLPVITYEAVPEALPAYRLKLPTPPGYRVGTHQDRKLTAIHHFGHTADPVFTGQCNGASFCTLGGYAMESQCHAGMRCTYDTVADHGWSVSLRTHSIDSVIHGVLEKYDTVPACEIVENCSDCPNWTFYESNGSTKTTSLTSTSTSSTRTRTETCKTPGWWGCRDKTTTTSGITTTTTSSSTTTTCKTPGWFGCKDPTTTTITSSSTTSTSTCETPGFFGCNDPSTTTTTVTTTGSSVSPPTTQKPTHRPTATSSPSCRSPGWFGGCNDPTTTTSTITLPRTTQAPTTTATSRSSASSSTSTCRAKHWWGTCKD